MPPSSVAATDSPVGRWRAQARTRHPRGASRTVERADMAE